MGWSKEKRAEYMRKWRANNKDKVKKYSRKSYEKSKLNGKLTYVYVPQDKDKAREYQAKYREENREKFNEYHRNYRKNNREAYNKYHREYYSKKSQISS